LNGISLNIVDTAGIRWTKDTVERIGVDKAKQAAEKADLILFVVDASGALDDDDAEILRELGKKKVIFILNKIDLPNNVTEIDFEKYLHGIGSDNGDQARFSKEEIIRVSAKEGLGLEDLEQKITEMFFHGKLDFNEGICFTNARHKYAMEKADKSLYQVMESIKMGMPEDFYSIDLMDAYRELGGIIGEEVDEDLVNTIFKEFCMGK